MMRSPDAALAEVGFNLWNPSASAVPLVVDSPHSWGLWPESVASTAPRSALASSWDAYVDDLWAFALDGQAPLLSARFHRSLIDVNRARDDIDPGMLDGAWPSALNPTDKSDRGFGLIRRYALPGVPVYDRLLSVDEVMERIERLYDPYHLKLGELIAQQHAHHGSCLHLDCHSMKSIGNAMNDDNGAARPDMVVSDLDGLSASRQWTQRVAALLRSLGYKVGVNDPYKGAELIRRHGKPSAGIHSIQIEINRAIYMNEQTFEKSSGYDVLAANLRRFVAKLSVALTSPAQEHLCAKH